MTHLKPRNSRLSLSAHGGLWLILANTLLLSNCMVASMHGHGYKRPGAPAPKKPHSVQSQLEGMIDKAVSNLIEVNLPVETIAVTHVRSEDGALSSEVAKQKITDRLVRAGRYKVLTRDALEQLLREQGLTASGIVDSAYTGTGRLPGVEAILEAYISLEGSQRGLYMKLIYSRSGEIAWSFTISEAL